MKKYYKTDLMERGLSSPLPTPFAPKPGDLVIYYSHSSTPRLQLGKLETRDNDLYVENVSSQEQNVTSRILYESSQYWKAFTFDFADEELNYTLRDIPTFALADALSLNEPRDPSRMKSLDLLGYDIQVGDIVAFAKSNEAIGFGRVVRASAMVAIEEVERNGLARVYKDANTVIAFQVSDEDRDAIHAMSSEDVRKFYSSDVLS
jgi:hypothetical protein